MGREGPCFHCGIEQTPLWRPRPSGKPVLYNACGSRWRTKGTLDDYLPKHASRVKQSSQLPSKMKQHLLTHGDQKLEVGIEVYGKNGSSACLEEEMNKIPSLVLAGPSSDNCMQTEETNDPLWNPDSVPKRRRSNNRPHILSPAERLQRRLHKKLREPDFENISDDEETITLIYARRKYIAPNEIGLGAMLFVPPPTTTERSTSLSTMTR